jgi:hypothetical protein
MTMARWLFAASVVAMLSVSALVQAETITLDAVQDASCGERPSTNRGLNFDGQKTPISNVGTSDRWFALYQFDLSQLSGDITSAHIELYDLGTGGYQTLAFNSDQYIVSPKAGATDQQLVFAGVGGNAFDQNGVHETAIDYTAYVAAVNATTGYWVESSSVMSLTLPANNAGGQYYASADADATMLGLLNAQRISRGYVVMLGYRGAAGTKRTFDDAEGGHAPRLVVDSVPEPAMLVLLAGMALALAGMRRRSRA